MINVVSNLLNFSSTGVNATGIYIKSGSASVYGINLINSNSFPLYCKLFDKNSTPNIGIDTPKAIILVPSTGVIQAGVNIQPNLMPYRYFSSGLYISANSGIADSNVGSLPISLYAEVAYL